MRFLIDTHIFIWFVEDDARLKEGNKQLIEDYNNEIFVSHASLWEMAIKVSAEKLTLAPSYLEWTSFHISTNRLQILDTRISHFVIVSQLPFHHRDPFDRLIAAQSLSENLPLISADSVFDAYGVERHF